MSADSPSSGAALLLSGRVVVWRVDENIVAAACVTTPLVVSVTKWPTGQTGSKSGTWNSGTSTLTEAAFLWNPARFRATDARGCTVTVTR